MNNFPTIKMAFRGPEDFWVIDLDRRIALYGKDTDADKLQNDEKLLEIHARQKLEERRTQLIETYPSLTTENEALFSKVLHIAHKALVTLERPHG